MVFCNVIDTFCRVCEAAVTILILVDGFLQLKKQKKILKQLIQVTILILVDGFLQYCKPVKKVYNYQCHNPYFSRWFSAIMGSLCQLIRVEKSQSLF